MDRLKYNDINKKHMTDTGLALLLVFLVIMLFFETYELLPYSILILLISMVFPIIFKPLAFIWFNIASILGNIVSRIILLFVFFIIITPIGVVRRILGADSMKLNKWKKDKESVFVVREILFTKADMENPY